MTITDALNAAIATLKTAEIEEARLDSQLLLAWTIKGRREDLIREPGRALSSRERLIFEKTIQLRSEHRPVAYITGEQWFYGRPFKINRAVLIPRPETEMLVEFALRTCAQSQTPKPRILDIGTGSGCIAVSIACELPNSHITAVDISALALLVAAKNVHRHGVQDRVLLSQSNLFDSVAGELYDLIVSNPPYIPPSDMVTLMPEVRDYEPKLALCEGAGEKGTDLHRRILDRAPEFLKPAGWVALEVGEGQADGVCNYAGEIGYTHSLTEQDRAGIERVVYAQWRG